MEFHTVEDALHILGEASFDRLTRRDAYHFIMNVPEEARIPQLIDALQSDNVAVRWEAGKLLTEMGHPALLGMLNTLTNPKKVGNPRIRNGIAHVLRDSHDPTVRELSVSLLNALHGPAADLNAMREASHVLQQISERTGEQRP